MAARLLVWSLGQALDADDLRGVELLLSQAHLSGTESTASLGVRMMLSATRLRAIRLLKQPHGIELARLKGLIAEATASEALELVLTFVQVGLFVEPHEFDFAIELYQRALTYLEDVRWPGEDATAARVESALPCTI